GLFTDQKKRRLLLNSLKNRDKPPFTTTKYTSVAKLEAVLLKLSDKKCIAINGFQRLKTLPRFGSHAVTVEGYLVYQAVRQGKEDCWKAERTGPETSSESSVSSA